MPRHAARLAPGVHDRAAMNTKLRFEMATSTMAAWNARKRSAGMNIESKRNRGAPISCRTWHSDRCPVNSCTAMTVAISDLVASPRIGIPTQGPPCSRAESTKTTTCWPPAIKTLRNSTVEAGVRCRRHLPSFLCVHHVQSHSIQCSSLVGQAYEARGLPIAGNEVRTQRLIKLSRA